MNLNNLGKILKADLDETKKAMGILIKRGLGRPIYNIEISAKALREKAEREIQELLKEVEEMKKEAENQKKEFHIASLSDGYGKAKYLYSQNQRQNQK